MRALTLLHRWLGIPFAPLFAMWFASGMIMHVVPYPTLSDAERVAGMAPIDIARVLHGPPDAVAASGIAGAPRVRLVQRPDAPVYVVSGAGRLAALRADDLAPADVRTANLALVIAKDHAQRRGLDAARETVAGITHHDQWTVAGDLDLYRPLWRIALNDEAGTELYVSSVTGEIVRDTTQRERWWSYPGSVAHWLYPTALRAHRGAWIATVWLVSGLASLAAMAGALLGVAMLVVRRGRLTESGHWQRWHHALGLLCGIFVLGWIVTGWLSVDDGAVLPACQLYGALHTLDFPVLTSRPVLRSTLVFVLCGCGLVFSLTGCVLAWRRMSGARTRPTGASK